MIFVAGTRKAIRDVEEVVDRIGDAGAALRAAAPGLAGRVERADTAVLLHEMRRTLHAIATAAAVVTDLRRAAPAAAASFIESLRVQQEKARNIDLALDAMRGECGRMREHADRLHRATGWSLPAGVAGLCNDREQFHVLVDELAGAVRSALDDVQGELELPGVLLSENLEAARRALGAQAAAFEAIHARCDALDEQLQELIDEVVH